MPQEGPPPNAPAALKRLASELYPTWYEDYGYQFLLKLYAAVFAIDGDEYRTEFLIQKFADQLSFRYREEIFQPMPLYLAGTMSREISRALDGMSEFGLLQSRESNMSGVDADVYIPTTDIPAEATRDESRYSSIFDEAVGTNTKSQFPHKSLRGFFESHDEDLYKRYTDDENYVGFDYELLHDIYQNGGSDPMLSEVKKTLRKTDHHLENYGMELALTLLRDYKNIGGDNETEAKRKLSVPHLTNSPHASAAGTVGLYVGYFDLNAQENRENSSLNGDWLLRQCPTDTEAIPVQFDGECEFSTAKLPDHAVGILGVVEVVAGEKILNALSILSFGRLPEELREEQASADKRITDQRQQEILANLATGQDELANALEQLQQDQDLNEEDKELLQQALDRLRNTTDDIERGRVIWNLFKNEAYVDILQSALEYI